VQTIAGEQVVPNLQYTVRILASNGMYTTASTALVPTAYPTDLTKTFSLTLGGSPGVMPTLTVKVVNSSNVVQPNAAVTVSGGPGSNILLTGVTDANGLATFSVPSNTSPGYTMSATSGTLTGTTSSGVTATITKTVTVR
jgi:hypothetical protein